MYWVLGVLVAVLLFMAPVIGFLSQPWAPWWIGQQSVNSIQFGANPTPVVVATTDRPTPVTALVPTPALPRLLNVIDIAKTWLGTPYLWGGCTKRGVDCSCFMQNIFREVGIQMPRVTVDQIRWAIPITREQATAGDLVFFDNTCSDCGANPTHVGLVLDRGGGTMIDAGDPVRIEPIYSGHNARYGRVHL